MPVLNYTTNVPVDRTLGEIQHILRDARARSVVIHYDDNGEPSGVGCLLNTPGGVKPFLLPANVDAALQVLQEARDRGELRSHIKIDRDQAARVAWRVVRDWLESQMTLVRFRQATFDQVMLPYLQVEPGLTLYDSFKLPVALLQVGAAVGSSRA